MNDTSNIGFFYTLCLAAFLALALAASHLLDDTPPSSLEGYADRLCQELYGPQVGHKWVDRALHCETVRGEVVEVRQP